MRFRLRFRLRFGIAALLCDEDLERVEGGVERGGDPRGGVDVGADGEGRGEAGKVVHGEVEGVVAVPLRDAVGAQVHGVAVDAVVLHLVSADGRLAFITDWECKRCI